MIIKFLSISTELKPVDAAMKEKIHSRSLTISKRLETEKEEIVIETLKNELELINELVEGRTEILKHH
jgi:hypothetical protein